MQIGTILLVSVVIGRLCKRFHQPQVIGETLAGVLLGPSLLVDCQATFAQANECRSSCDLLSVFAQPKV
jgi:Kef-type K+ transport system membrane component KefB